MYSDEFFKEILTGSRREAEAFFSALQCDRCPLHFENCGSGSCEASLRRYYFDKCAETRSEESKPAPKEEEPSIEESEPAAANTQPEEEEINIRELVALRRDVNRKYKQLKDKIFANLVEEMYKSGKFHTAEELSDMCGLSINTIANHFKYIRNRSCWLFGNYYLETAQEWKCTTYVRLLPNGEVDKSRQLDQRRIVLTYRVIKR